MIAETLMDRGTGKTTVLETFKRDSRTPTSETALKDRPDADEETRSGLKRSHAERETFLNQIRGRVVWFETLDMEPLTRHPARYRRKAVAA